MVIIFGATGFIGMYTARAFMDAGIQVAAVGRNPRSGDALRKQGAIFYKMDITDEDAFTQLPSDDVDGVVILSGLMPANSRADLRDTENASDYFRVNVIGTINILEYCRKNNIKKIIGNCSYNDVSEAWDKKYPITENEPRNFSFLGDHAAYVISKCACNDIMEYYNQQHNMQCAWFRLPPVYGVGPHDMIFVNGRPKKSGIATFIDNAQEGKDIEIWGNPHLKRDLIYVKDVAEAYVLAMRSRYTKGLYNMTGHIQVDLEEQVRTVIEVFGGEKESKVIYRPEMMNSTPSYLYSMDKAKRDFDFEPKYTDYKKMMEDYKVELESGYWKIFNERCDKKKILRNELGGSTVIVFGATGYIGRYLCPFLKGKGYHVLALGRSKSGQKFLENQGINFLHFDITDEDAFKNLPTQNVNAIIDLATVLPEFEGIPPRNFFDVNTLGAERVLQFARNNKISKVIFASTHKITNNVKKKVISENDIAFTGAHTLYIISKLSTERLVNYYNDAFGMQGVVLRLTGVHGYGEMMGTLSPDGSYHMSAFEGFVSKAVRGEKIEVWGDQSIVRDHVYIKDVLTAFLAAINSSDAKGVFQIASGKGYSQYDEALAIAEIFGENKKKSTVVLRPDKPGLVRGYVYDITKAKRELGWYPEYVDLQTWLEDYKKEWKRKIYHHYHKVKEEDRPITFL